MKRARLTLALLGALASLCSCIEEGEAVYSNTLEAALTPLRKALEARVGAPVPSLNALIDTPRAIYYASSIPETGEKVTADTNFRFGGSTKLFVAAAILKMHEDGWLDYRDRIVDPIPGSGQPYVPDDPRWAIPYKEEITIEQLLQHSAGVVDVESDTRYAVEVLAAEPDHQFTAAELVRQATNRTPYFKPGIDHHHSDTGYTILGEIVARVYSARLGEARTVGDYLYRHLYGPAARVPLPIGFAERAADRALPLPHVCGTIHEPAEGEAARACDANMTAHVAEGNGWGTLRALNQFVRTLMKGENVLGAKSVELMKTDLTPALDPKNRTYGLGCRTYENIGHGHEGAANGYLSLMAYDPKTGVSVVTLMPFADPQRLADCAKTVHDAAWAAREAFGFPGKPSATTK